MAVRIKQFLFGILIFTLPVFSADSKVSHSEPTQEETYLAYAEEMPQVNGGLASIMKTIKYPQRAVQLGVEGVVYVMAFIDESGNVNDAKVIKGIGGCDETAVEAVKKAKISPAKNKGQSVKVKMSYQLNL